MTSITIHNLDESVAALLRARARAENASLNQTIKRLLESALGVRPPTGANRGHFEKFCGIWSKAQRAEFEKSTKDFERIDREAWK